MFMELPLTSEEKDLVIKEAEEILDVEDVIASIILVDDLRIQKELIIFCNQFYLLNKQQLKQD